MLLVLIQNKYAFKFYAISTKFSKLSTYFEINHFIFLFFLDMIYFISISCGKLGLLAQSL